MVVWMKAGEARTPDIQQERGPDYPGSRLTLVAGESTAILIMSATACNSNRPGDATADELRLEITLKNRRLAAVSLVVRQQVSLFASPTALRLGDFFFVFGFVLDFCPDVEFLFLAFLLV